MRVGTLRARRAFVFRASQRLNDAGEANHRESPEGQACRQGGFHASRRIRARRDPQNPAWGARGPIAGTGHSHRPLQGQTCRRCACSAEERHSRGPHTREAPKTPIRRASINASRDASREISRAMLQVLKREPRSTASHEALARHARKAASQRSAAERSAAARQAVRTKGPAGRSAQARKAARTRARHRR